MLLLIAALTLNPANAAAPEEDGLVDASFAVAPATELLVSTPVVQQAPAVPASVGVPGGSETMVWVILALLGGFMAGMLTGVLACCFLYYSGFY